MEGASFEKMPPRSWTEAKPGDRFLIHDFRERTQSIMGGSITGLVAMGSIRKKVEQAMRIKPPNSFHPWPPHQLLTPGFCPA